MLTIKTPGGHPLAQIHERTMKTLQAPTRHITDTPAWHAIFAHVQAAGYPKQPRMGWKGNCMVVPCVSTIHIPKEDGKRLVEEGGLPNEGPLFTRYDNGGHIIALCDEYDPSDWAQYSQEMRDLTEAFHTHGYRFLRLDAEGDIIKGLRTFDW